MPAEVRGCLDGALRVSTLEYKTISVAYRKAMIRVDLVKRSVGAADEIAKVGCADTIRTRPSVAELQCNNR